MRVDTSINVPTILSAIGLVIALWSFATKIETRLTAVEIKVDALWSQYAVGR